MVIRILDWLKSCRGQPNIRLIGQSHSTFPAPNRSVTMDTSSFTLVRNSLFTFELWTLKQSQWTLCIRLSHSPTTHSQNQIHQTIPMDTPSLRLIDWTLPASDWSYCLCGHSTTSDWSNSASGHPKPRTYNSHWTPYNLRLITRSHWTPSLLLGETVPMRPTDPMIRYSQWTPPVSDWSQSRSGHSTTSDWSNRRSGHPIHLNWSDIHSGHPHPRTDQAVPVPCNLRLIRQSQRTRLKLRLISRPGGHTKTSDWSDIHSRHPTTSDWSDSPTGHPTIWGWSEIHSWTPQPQTDQTVPMDTPSFSPCSMNNTIFMFELDSTRRSWSK